MDSPWESIHDGLPTINNHQQLLCFIPNELSYWFNTQACATCIHQGQLKLILWQADPTQQLERKYF